MVAAKIVLMKFIVPTPKTVSLQPPMASGAYLLAALPTLLTKGLQPILHDLHAKLGSVFTINIFGLKKVTFLIGPEVTAHFFEGTHAEICQPDMYKLTVPIFGKGILLDADFATHSKQIKLSRDVMRTGELRRHVDPMVREVEVRMHVPTESRRTWIPGSAYKVENPILNF
jgi:sterol 14-demethylase